MQDIFFLFSWCVQPFLWLVMLRAAGLNVFKFNLPIIVLAFIILQQYLGFPVLYFKLNEYRALFVKDKELVLLTYIYTSLCISLLIIGMICGNWYLGRLEDFKSRSKGFMIMQPFQRVNLIILGGITLFIFYLYVNTVGLYNLAIASVLGFGDDVSLAFARSQMGNAFAGKYHWFELFFRDVLLFIVLVAYAEYLFFKNKFNRYFLIAFIPLLFFSMIMATEKGPLVDLLITFWILHLIVRNKGKVDPQKVFKFGFAIISILVVMYLLFMGTTGVGSSLASLFSRAMTGQIQPAYHYLEMFPEYEGWLYGRSLPNPKGIIPFEHYKLTTEVMHFVNPQLRAMGITGSMPTIFWAELYANFSFVGVLFGSFLVGMLLYVLNYLIFNLPFNAMSLALYAYLIMHYKSLATTSFSNYIFDLDLITVLIIALLVMKLNWVLMPKKNQAISG